MTKAIVFDFDGVLVDSNEVKVQAFYRMWPAEDAEMQQRIRDVLSQMRESSRYDILREIFRRSNVEGQDLERLVAEFAEKYNAIVQCGIQETRPGVRDILPGLAQKFSLFIDSATPQPALRETVERLGLAPYFSSCYGGPATKEENLDMILQEVGCPASEVMYVGDGISDLRAAQNAGCRFIGVPNQWNGWSGDAFPLMPEFNSIISYL